MNTVSVSRTVDAPPSDAVDRLRDLDALVEAAGFDEVHVDGDRVRVVNHVSLATMELTVTVVDSDAALAYEQVDGIFDEMVTRYEVEGGDAGYGDGGVDAESDVEETERGERVETDGTESDPEAKGTGEAASDGTGETTVAATTEFAVGAGPLGSLLDATIIERQRRRELLGQLDYLAGE